jgi:hypothetical protein
MAQEQRKAELTAELAAARRRISSDFGALRYSLDFPRRAKDAVKRHPFAWVGGATLFGVLLSKLPARRKKVLVTSKGEAVKKSGAVQAGLLVSVLKIALDVARPVLMKWATQRVADYMDPSRNDSRSPR